MENNKSTERNINNIAISHVADDFLNVGEDSLETRAYLMKTTIPTVVMALEGLMKEMTNRGLEMNGIRTKKPDASQLDMPNISFDSLNWLAQYLYRNNPLHSEVSKSDYVKNSEEITAKLEARIKRIAEEKKAKILADAIAAGLERERLIKERIAKLAERKQQYSELLELSFKIWMQSLWRKDPGSLYLSEIIEEFKYVINVPDIQIDTNLCEKIMNLNEILSSPNSKLPTANEDNTIFDEKDPVYQVDCAIIDRWESDIYVKIILRLIINWTLPELTKFLQVLSTKITNNGNEMPQIFSDSLFVPKFSRISVIRDWYQHLTPYIQILDLSNLSIKETVKRACQGFCLGREDPRFAFVQIGTMKDTVVEHSNAAIAFAETAYVRFMKCILGEFGIECFKELMEHIKKEYSRNGLSTASSEQAISKIVEKPIDQSVLNLILEKMKLLPRNGNEIEAQHFLSLLSTGIKKYENDGNSFDMLTALKSLVSASTTITLPVLVKYIEKSSLNIEQNALKLAEIIVILNTDIQKEIEESHKLLSEEDLKKRLRQTNENYALEQLKQLKKNVNMTFRNCGEIIIGIIENLYSKLYPDSNAFGRLSLMETAVTKLIDGKDKLKEDEDLAGNAIVESFLRVVSCSPLLHDDFFGLKIEKQGLDYEIMAAKIERKIISPETETNQTYKEDIFFKSSLLETLENPTFIGSPFLSETGFCFGAIDFIIENQEFNNQDLLFINAASKIISETLELVQNRKYMFDLGFAAKEYMESRVGKNISLYYNFEEYGMFSLADYVQPVIEEGKTNYPFGSAILMCGVPKISEVTTDSSQYNNLKTVIDSHEITDFEQEVFLPVLHPDTRRCIAVVSFQGNDEDMRTTLESCCKILGIGIKNQINNSFGKSDLDVLLDAERIDENCTLKLHFGKLVLLNAREKLLEVNSKTIAELKSYRKPPISIHRILKGALYLFGHQPKALKTWNDIIKHITLDLVQLLIKFDPTSTHKKIRFRRAKQILKLVSWDDSRQKGSKPAQIICEWLIVTVALREIAVRGRKMRPDIYERIGTADSKANQEELEDNSDLDALEVDEEPEDIHHEGDLTDAEGNVIKNIDLSS